MRIGLIAIDGCFGSAVASIIDIVRVADGARGDVDDRRDSRTEAAVDRDQSDTHGANNSNTAVYATSHMPLLVIR